MYSKTLSASLYGLSGERTWVEVDAGRGMPVFSVVGLANQSVREAKERIHSAIINCGIALCKYTGGGGKSSTNDASGEYVGKIRKIFDDNGVVWQTCELGKVDQGGGGTVAKFISEKNIDTVDVGVPVISMHAPYEVVSKFDVYNMHKAVVAFYTAE